MYGNGVLKTDDYDTFKLLQLQEESIADGTNFVIKIDLVNYDNTGKPIANGVSSISVTQDGTPLEFTHRGGTSISLNSGLTYREGTDGAVSGNLDSSDGFVVAETSDYTQGSPDSPLETHYFS